MLLTYGADVNYQDDNGYTGVKTAVEVGDLEMVKLLLGAGGDMTILSAMDADDALHWAAREGHVEMGRLLLAYGANVNYQDNTGCTALNIAVEEGCVEMVNFLLDAGADMTILGGWGSGNVLHTAAKNENVEVVALLLQRGADPNAPDMDGCTASYLQHFFRRLGKNSPEETSQILALLKAAGATD